MTDREKIEILTIATDLHAGEEVEWRRIMNAYNTIGGSKTTHRNYKAYTILRFYMENKEDIDKTFQDDLQNKIIEAKNKTKWKNQTQS